MNGADRASGKGDYLGLVAGRLVDAGFSWADQVSGLHGSFRAVAHMKRLQLTKFGFWETFFVFSEFEHLDRASMQTFMRDAVQHALASRSSQLPRGLFAGLATYGVALADHVDEATAGAVRKEEPPKHWAMNEIPVVYDAEAARLDYFERTPVWGAAYYKGHRKQIEQYLGPVPHFGG